MKLQQGQVWKKGDEFIRIVHLERLEVKYKAMKDLFTKEGVHHHVSKKEFCRLIKDAEVLSDSEIKDGLPAVASSRDANKAVVKNYVEAFNRGDLAALEALFAPDAVIQGVLATGGMGTILGIWKQLHESFAIELTIEEVIAEGDCVAVRYIERGTFRAAFRGHAPTGKSYELVAMEWFEVKDAKIHRRWGVRDAASQAKQIGLPLES